MRTSIRVLLPALLFVVTGPPVYAQVATPDEARIVAESWLRFIVERDGGWGGAAQPQISAWTELRREDRLLGWCATVDPIGYMVVSALTDFPPVTAYSTTSDFDAADQGMPALVQGALDNRARFLLQHFGGLDAVHLSAVARYTPESNRQTWAILRSQPADLAGQLLGTARSRTVVGPLLETTWRQGAPYNNMCPEGGECAHTQVGCVPLAMAQVMRYYCWPGYEYDWFDWANMPTGITYSAQHNRFELPDGSPATQAQLDAVAFLCMRAGSNDWIYTWYGCTSTDAFVCDNVFDDAYESMATPFKYANATSPCEDRANYTYTQWWNKLVAQLNQRQPMIYRIASSSGDFSHAIVIDGYNDGTHQVHANYGWANAHTMWYALDEFDCDNAPGFQGGCDYNEEEMIGNLYPNTRLGQSLTGNIGPYDGMFDDPHDYIQYDATAVVPVLVAGGAWIQFFPGSALKTDFYPILVGGRSPLSTRFFSYNWPARTGIRVYAGGGMRFLPGSGVRFH
jgi:hypothetical protein